MKTDTVIRIVALFAFLLIAPPVIRAAHLPIKNYTTSDGLANDSVNKIVRDSRGFLWFCTGEGLSRFDGSGFKNYRQTDGLPHRNINDFLETAGGDLLVATTNGLAVLDPDGTAYGWNILTGKLEQTSDAKPLFRTFLTPNPGDEPKKRSVLNLVQASDGRIFAVTVTTLYELEKSDDVWTFKAVKSDLFDAQTVFGAAEFDRFGYLWILASTGIFRLSPDGVATEVGGDGAASLLFDRESRVWVGGSGTDSGLRVFTVSDDGKTAKLAMVYRKSDGLPIENSMYELQQTSDGRILALVGETLCEFLPEAGANEKKFRILAEGRFQTIEEDVGGALWLGTIQDGAAKISRSGFVTFGTEDGIPDADITSLFTNPAGQLFITSGIRDILQLGSERFENIVPKAATRRSWGFGQLDFQSANGDWWISSRRGLEVYPKPAANAGLANLTPKQRFTTADGLFSDDVFNIFEDSRGDVWISTTTSVDSLQLWQRKTGKIIRFTAVDGLPGSNGPRTFAEDSAGNIWFGFFFGGLARFKDGEFRFFGSDNGIPVGSINSIFSDSKGTLWLASASRGVFRTDDPTAESPHFTNISTAGGLSSNQANCVTEDLFGQIYIGTGSGVNRLNPANGNLKFYTQADGLPGSVVSLCRRDAAGALWFAADRSLVRFVPQAETVSKPPPVYIGGVYVNGTSQKVSELGTTNVTGLNLGADQKQVKIEFFALGFGSGERLHFQYKLGEQDWSAADEQKSVTFNLDAGDYEFAVRAVNGDDVASAFPATVSFKIASPFYRQGWFLFLSALFAGGVVLAVERSRAARLRGLRSAFGKLSVSENRFRQMNDQSPLGIIVFAPDGSIRAVNRAYENFLGITFEEIRHWDFFNDPQLIKIGVIEKLRRVFAGETVHFPPEPYDPRDNNHGVGVDAKSTIPWFESFAYPVKNDAGELLEVILVMEDVTDTKRADEIERTAKSERLRELEQVRRRIAADLHDDIGSSLTQISIFSEVLQQRVDKTNVKVLEPLEFIAASSRELVDAMSDIVWAINPQKDFLSELSGKMRRFAADVFTARNIVFTYSATPLPDIPLGANLRREVFLIFKETVSNIVKHADCTNVHIELNIGHSEILLRIRDDGLGFDTKGESDGHGLVSMHARANGLGGKLQIVSGDGAGTEVTLVIPFISEQ